VNGRHCRLSASGHLSFTFPPTIVLCGCRSASGSRAGGLLLQTRTSDQAASRSDGTARKCLLARRRWGSVVLAVSPIGRNDLWPFVRGIGALRWVMKMPPATGWHKRLSGGNGLSSWCGKRQARTLQMYRLSFPSSAIADLPVVDGPLKAWSENCDDVDI